jgi:hypothetical protein
LPATNAKRLRKGALATKQSSLHACCAKAGLLRFARNDGGGVLVSPPIKENALISMDCRVKPGNDENRTTMESAHAK